MNAPHSIAKRGVHASTGFFAWRPLFIVESPFGPRTYTTPYSLLEAADESQPQWTIHVWGSHVQPPANGELPVFPQTVGQIDGSPLRVFPAQCRISWNSGGVLRQVVLDCCGDVIYNTPPAKQVNVEVMLSRSSVRLANQGNTGVLVQSGPSTIGAAAGPVIGGRINATAWSLASLEPCSEPDVSALDPAMADIMAHSSRRLWSPVSSQERSRNRMTEVIDIIGLSSAVLQVPAGASAVAVYQAPLAGVGLAGAIAGRFLAWFDAAVPANSLPLGEWPTVSGGPVLQRTGMPVPGMSTHMQIFTTSATASRAICVWDID